MILFYNKLQYGAKLQPQLSQFHVCGHRTFWNYHDDVWSFCEKCLCHENKTASLDSKVTTFFKDRAKFSHRTLPKDILKVSMRGFCPSFKKSG